MAELLSSKSAWEAFFYYGEIDQEDESLYDLHELLLQQKRSLFYFRRAGGGVSEYENVPSSIMLSLAKAEIANAIAYRNSYVSDGSDGLRDRRIAVSQEYIDIKQVDLGEINVEIYYFLYKDFQDPKANSFKLVR